MDNSLVAKLSISSATVSLAQNSISYKIASIKIIILVRMLFVGKHQAIHYINSIAKLTGT